MNRRLPAVVVAVLILFSCHDVRSTLDEALGVRDKVAPQPVAIDVLCDPSAGSTCSERELRHVLTGSLTQYRSPFRMLYTEGVRHLLKESEGVIGASGQRCGGAYWLLDTITFHQPKARRACDGFQLWSLTVENGGAGPGATLTCRADSDQEPVITEKIEHTDFPLPSVKLYVIDNVALLPDEY